MVTMKRQLRRLGLGHDDRRTIATIDEELLPLDAVDLPADLQQLVRRVAPRAAAAGPVRSPSWRPCWSRASAPTPDGRAWSELSTAERRAVVDGERLAYTSEAPVNWCPGLGTVLANEEVTADGRSERGNFPVFKRSLSQWMMRITAYSDRLVDDLERLDWPEPVKLMQRNWIGRSHGAQGVLPRPAGRRHDGADRGLHHPPRHAVRRDVHGAGARAPAGGLAGAAGRLARGHPGRLDRRRCATPAEAVAAYRLAASRKSDVERQTRGQGQDRCVHRRVRHEPGQRRAGPGLHRRLRPDGLRHRRHHGRPRPGRARLGVRREVRPAGRPDGAADRRATRRTRPFTGDGVAINSANDEISLDGMHVAEAKATIIDWLQDKGFGERTITYKLRDWLFSRQRYWGEPFPIVFDEDGVAHRACPSRCCRSSCRTCPTTRPRRSTPTTRSPRPSRRCRGSQEWVERRAGPGRRARMRSTAARPTPCPTGPARAGTTCATSTRPTTTRFVDPENERVLDGPARRDRSSAPRPARVDPGGVDLYVGGVEHAVLHLLYARFWHKVLFDLGHVSSEEPFRKYSPGLHPGLRLPRRPRPARAGGRGRRERRPRRTATSTCTWQGQPVTREYGKIGKSLKNVVSPGRDVRGVRRRHVPRLRDVDGSAGAVQAVGDPRRRRRPAVPAAAVAQRGRRGDRRGAGRRRAGRRRDEPLLHKTIDALSAATTTPCGSTRRSPG